jgi:hypothetical protein
MKLMSRWSSPIPVAVALSAMLVVVGFLSQAAGQEKKVVVSPSELPPAIKKAIQEAFPKGEILKIEKEVEGEDVGQFDVEIRSGGKEYEVEISKEGKVIETKEKSGGKTAEGEGAKEWTKDFAIEQCEFSSVGANRFFILKPGHQLVLEGGGEKVVITVLDETEKVGSVETRVVEEREYANGELKEVSRNFFAICKNTGNVFYFGEDVDDYKNGKIVRHSGAWRADKKNSQAGVIMPGTILLGARYYQEIAPNAMDRAENVRVNVTLKTPAGTFKNCLRTEETSGLDPDEKCYKTYAPGIGLIQDEDLLLTEYRTGKE